MTAVTPRLSIRALPGRRPRNRILAALRGAFARLLRPAAGRRLDPAALSDGMRRDLGFHDAYPSRHR